MKMFRKLAMSTAFIGLCFPYLLISTRHNVDVTWSFKEDVPRVHEISLQGKTFSIPSGESSSQPVQLRGGGRAALIWAFTDWGFQGQQILVDGNEISPSDIQISGKTGRLSILGMSRSRKMAAEILIKDHEE